MTIRESTGNNFLAALRFAPYTTMAMNPELFRITTANAID
jgi:hypothetical protein